MNEANRRLILLWDEEDPDVPEGYSEYLRKTYRQEMVLKALASEEGRAALSAAMRAPIIHNLRRGRGITHSFRIDPLLSTYDQSYILDD